MSAALGAQAVQLRARSCAPTHAWYCALLASSLLLLAAPKVRARAGGAVSSEPPQAPAAAPPARERKDHEDEDEALSLDVVRRNFETSYVVYPLGIWGLPPLYLEADVAPHFVVTQPHWHVALVLTPKILVRIFRQASSPVLTPSYMPRVALFAWPSEWLRPGAVTAYASLTFSHHSNGQSAPALSAPGVNNHETGDFSTNFVELSLYETQLHQVLFGWNALTLQWHPDVNRSVGLEDRYGLLRLIFSTTLITTDAPLEGALTLQLTAILDRFQRASGARVLRDLERFPLAVQYTVKVPGSDLGVFAGYYVGHDYYNIWFDKVINVLQIGLSGRVGPVTFEER